MHPTIRFRVFYQPMPYLHGAVIKVVDIVTGYGLDERGDGVRVPVVSRIFSMSSRSAPGPTQPPIQWVPEALPLEVKRHGHKADNSPPGSAEVKKIWSNTSTSPYAFMAQSLIN
jgi:hypothetical protein